MLSDSTSMPRFLQSAAGQNQDRARLALKLHFEAIWRFVRRLGVAQADVDDAAQRVFIIFAQRIDSIDPKAERSFLFSTAVRVAADARKTRTRSREVLCDNIAAFEHKDPTPDLEQQLDDRKMRRLLDQALDTLSDEHRSVFVLVDVERHTMAEVSELLGIAAGTVASRLRRARGLFELAANDLRTTLERRVRQ